MSKSRNYKKKSKANSNIFVILAIVLVVLIVAVVIFTSVDNSKYNGLLESYTEHEYGEKQNVKLARGYDSTTGIVVYSNDDYIYYVDDNVIYDVNKNAEAAQGFNAVATSLKEELGEISTSAYGTYTDGSDFSKTYDYIEVSAAYDGVLGGKEVAAEKIWNFVSSFGETYNICGMNFGYSDTETYYYVTLNTIDKETVTLEKITENIMSFDFSADITGEADTEGDVVADEGTENVDGEAETEVTDEESAE